MPNWYNPNIDKKILKDLMKRKDLPAMDKYSLFFCLLIRSGYLHGYHGEHGGLSLAFLLYGNIYSFLNARWHEFGHRSAFKTRWLNDFFYQICSFLRLF